MRQNNSLRNYIIAEKVTASNLQEGAEKDG